VANARGADKTLTEMRTRIRTECVDPDALRFPVADVDIALEDALQFVMAELWGRDPGEAIVRNEFTYAADTDSMDLPAAIRNRPITRIEDITTTTDPLRILYVPPGDVERQRDERRVYTLFGGDTADDAPQVSIRGTPATSVPLRVHFVAGAWIPGVAGDSIQAPPWLIRLVALTAAKQLRAPEGEWTMQQAEELAKHEEQLYFVGHQHEGPRTLADIG